MSQSIFISYRRLDSPGHAGRLYDRLAEAYGRDEVFMDVDALSPGETFRNRIERTLATTAAVVVVIGPDWLGELERRSADSEPDLLAEEVASALERGILVVPALVEGARMPRRQELPDRLAALAERNALEITDSRWDYDAGRLVKVIGTVPGITRAPESRAPHGRRWTIAIAAALVAAIAVGSFVYLGQPGTGPTSGDGGRPRAERLAFSIGDPILEDFLDKLTVAIEKHNWPRVLTLFGEDNFLTQKGMGIDEPQYIAEGLGLHSVDNSIVGEGQHIDFVHLNRIERIRLTGLRNWNGAAAERGEPELFDVLGTVWLSDGSQLRVSIELKKKATGGYELGIAVG